MNDADAIRRTVRRSTAVLVLSVSVLVGSLDLRARGPAMALAAFATLYLAGSFIYAPPAEFASDRDGDEDGSDGGDDSRDRVAAADDA